MGDHQAQVEKVLLERAINILQVGVTVANPEGIIIFTNSAEAEMHGYEVDELIGNDVGIFAPGNFRKPIAIDQRRYFERESVNIHRSGKIFPVKLISDVVVGTAGEPLGIITACEDMTRLQNTLRESSEIRVYNFQWQKLEVINDLVRSIAHDIGSTLTALMGYVDMIIKKGERGLPIQREHKQLQRLFEQIKLLVAELYKFSQPSQVDFKIAEINEIVKRTQIILNAIVGPKIEFRFKLGEDLWKIMANESSIEQAIINLVINAKNAMPNGGHIYIKTENVVFDEAAMVQSSGLRAGKFICLSIIDTGEGIDKDSINKIFEPFFTTKPFGQGLGLSIVHRNIELHNGWLEVFSMPGKGTVFKIYLPKH